ncbi:unnamed protein product [Miscanthus lutarioriparius]|uniref:Phosphomannose isomerase type I catalytic domain-containing protein n=1 Tax=Miscanthus lutarioriparius TaxID=422564 RepID=A0A811PQX7_9POAL|nr:unnamed protein product [Miscanthus lutarioriparius]
MTQENGRTRSSSLATPHRALLGPWAATKEKRRETRLPLQPQRKNPSAPPMDMEDPPPPPQRLCCAVQHYEWGRRGSASLVARLADQQDPDPDPDPDAELWMERTRWAPPRSSTTTARASSCSSATGSRGNPTRSVPPSPRAGEATSHSSSRTLTDKEQLVLSLERQYQEDVGVLATLFFNYVKLSPGEALYIGANEPHAYLSGECIECMATSDNVVRAGLTPKYKDIQTLCSNANIQTGIPGNLARRSCAATRPSVFLVITGEGELQADSLSDGKKKAKEGDVFFVPANTEIKLSNRGPESMQLYRAGVNSIFFS